MKRLSMFLAVLICLNLLVPVGYAKSEDYIDVSIEEVYLSRGNFKPGDHPELFVRIKNNGTVPTPPSGQWHWVVENLVGADFGGSNNKRMHAHISCDPGGETTLEMSGMTVTDSYIEFDLTLDKDGKLNDANPKDNKQRVKLSPIVDTVDLRIMNVYASPNNFAVGDTVKLYAKTLNNGDKDMRYSSVKFDYSINGKDFSVNKVFSLDGGETDELLLGEFTADSADMTVGAQVNTDKSITENKYYNNSFERNISSYTKDEEYVWDTTSVEQGGYVMSAVPDYVTKDVYVANDVGGFYRYNDDMGRHKYMFEGKGIDDTMAPAMAGVAIVPGDRNILFAACGSAKIGGRAFKEPGGLLKTEDGGKTWQNTNCPARYERCFSSYMLASDPNNKNVLYSGSFADGLWVSENVLDNAPTWTQINLPGFVSTETYNLSNAINCIAVDKNSGTVNGRTRRVYVSSYKNGIYVSEDGGRSFTLMNGSPKGVQGLRVALTGEVYAASSSTFVVDGEVHGNVNGAQNGIFKYDDGKWTDISPRVGSSYVNVDVSQINPECIVAATEFSVNYSSDGGKSWKNLFQNATVNFPDSHYSFAQHICMLTFDPKSEKSVWFGDWFATYRCSDTTAKDLVWDNIGRGYEQICVTQIICSEDFEGYYECAMDMGQVTVDHPFKYPEEQETFPMNVSGHALTYCFSNQNIIAISGGHARYQEGSGKSGYSLDGGRTYTMFETIPKKPNSEDNEYWGHIALSSGMNKNGMPTFIAAPRDGRPLWRTEDLGKTWEQVNLNVSNSAAYGNYIAMIADNHKNGYFYYIDAVTGKFYESSDDGKNFKETEAFTAGSSAYVLRNFSTNVGFIGLALGNNGLYISKDHAQTFTKVDNVQKAERFGIGKKAPYSEYDTLFVYGRVYNEVGMFRSTDLGKTWVKIDDYQCNGYVSITTVEGDKNRFGVVYAGTGGRGVYIGMPKDGDFRPVNIMLDDVDPVVRDEKLTLSGNSDREIEFDVSINGQTTRVKTDSNFKFSCDLTLKEGENNIRITGGSEVLGNRSEQNVTVTYNPDYVGIKTTEDYAVVGSHTYEIIGNINFSGSEVLINSQPVSVNSVNNSFRHFVNLIEGENEFLIEAKDEKGNSAQKTVKVIADTTAPTVNFISSNVTEDAFYTLRGTINEDATVTVNDSADLIAVGAGEFTVAVALKEGENPIKLNTKDSMGNVSEHEYIVSFNPTYEYSNEPDEAYVYGGSAVIDGSFDESGWHLDRTINKIYSGKTEDTAKFGLMADSNYLYIGIEVFDNYVTEVKDPTKSAYQIDSVEICIDPEGNRSGKYDALDRQLRLDLVNNNVFNCTKNSFVEGVESVVKLTETGYIIEAKIPLSEINLSYSPGLKFNADISINDCDTDEETRTSIIGWCADSANYTNTQNFGTVIFK